MARSTANSAQMTQTGISKVLGFRIGAVRLHAA